jgi:hypothetical protein
MNSSPSPYLERDASAVDPARHQEHLFVLDVDALDRADPGGEVERLRLGERRRRVPAAAGFPDHGRVEALLDRGPDRERRCEIESFDHQIRAVADPDLGDVREEVVGRVARRDVGETRLGADADEREQTAFVPLRCDRELLVAELDARELVRPFGMGSGKVHSHVQIGAAALERRVEDGRVEPRVTRVHDRGCARLARQRDDGLTIRRVHGRRREPPVAGKPFDRGRGVTWVDVGDDEVVEELAPLGRDRDRGADAAGSDDQHAHQRLTTTDRCSGRCRAPSRGTARRTPPARSRRARDRPRGTRSARPTPRGDRRRRSRAA